MMAAEQAAEGVADLGLGGALVEPQDGVQVGPFVTHDSGALGRGWLRSWSRPPPRLADDGRDHDVQALMACRSSPLLVMEILRGLACSATGIFKVSTPES